MRNTLLFSKTTTCKLSTCIKKTVTLSFLLAINFAAFSQTISPSDEIAKWNFVSSNVTVNGSTTSVKDEFGSGFTGTVMNDASIRTIGSTTKYNVLDLGNGTGYFDMGNGIGEAIYSLSNYTMSAFFRVNATNTDLSSTGNCLWNFSNSTNAPTDRNGYIFSSLRNQSQRITTGYWGSGEQVVGKESYNIATPSKDGWHHLAYTQNGTTGTIYIDGVLAATASITKLPSVVLPKAGFTGTPFNWIGRSCYPGDAYLKKTLVYGFNLYRVALTAANMTNYLNVPTIISDLNKAYAQDSGFGSANLLPFSAGIITGGEYVEQGMNSIPYTVPPITNASSYIWTLPAGATGTSSTNSINVNFTNAAVSGNITVKGHNNLGDGAASNLAITVNQSSVELTDTALNCVDTLILSANTATPVKMTFGPRGWGPEDIELVLIDQLSNKQVSHFTKHVTALCDTTLYLKSGKYIIKSISPDSVNGSPNLVISGENVYSLGWIVENDETHFDFKVIVKTLVCGGQSLLYANTHYTGTGKLKYKWTPSTGLDNDSIVNPTATVTNNTTYTVTVTSPNGCTATVHVFVAVGPLTVNAGTDKAIVCGGTAQLSNVITNYTGTGKLKYIWTPSTGLNNDTIANPTANAIGNMTYHVTVTSPSGCTASDSLKVLNTSLTANAGTDKTIVCGGTAQLSNVTTNYTGTGKLKYKWIPSTGLNNDSIINPSSNATGNITYTVTVTSPGGCTATDDIKVSVTPLNITQLRDTAVDGGGNVPLFLVTNYTGNGALKYKWTPSTGLDNDSISNPICSTFKNISYAVTVSSPNGCTATGNVNVTVRSMAKPVIGIVSVSTSNKNMIVWNKPVSTNIESYYVYRETTVSNVYEKIGTVPYDSLSLFVDNQSAPNVKSNKYKLSIFDRNGQESALSDAHKTMHLSINKGQNNTWNLIWEAYEGFNVSTYNIYRGTSVNNLNFIDATSGSSTQYSDISASTGDVFYQLEVISPTLINPSKAPASIQKSKDSGNATTSSLVSYNSSRSNVATNVVSSIPEFEEENNSIKLYPNPVKNELRIEYDGKTSFEIVNLMGQVIMNGNLNKSTIVQTSTLSSGVYLIKVRTGNSFEYKKIIKE